MISIVLQHALEVKANSLRDRIRSYV